MQPYIGITDFTSRADVDAMWEVFCTHGGPAAGYQLHVGVMMSYKTLNALPSKWAAVWPKHTELASIFSHEETYNCLHYADYDGNTDLAQSLSRAVSLCGPHLRSVQLDMVWPDPRELARFTAEHPHLEVILQVGRLAFHEVGNEPGGLVSRLRQYSGAVHRLLLDKSGGKGKALDAEALIPYLRKLRERLPTIGLGVAGGLGPWSMHLLGSLPSEFSDLSIDAQGRLRPSGDAKDPVDWNLARTYLKRGLAALT